MDNIINILISTLPIVGVISTYAVLKHRVGNLEKDLESHSKKFIDAKDKFETKLNANFKRLDEQSEKVTILQRDTANHLTMPIADKKYVSKDELNLHLKNIELQSIHTSKSVDAIEAKLEELISLTIENQKKK